MAEFSGISWTHHTFNPWIGCERVSPACAHCYADTLASGRMGRPGLWGGDETPRHITAESTWKKPLKWDRDAERDGVRRRVFCASMADVFEDRPDLEEPRERLFDLIDHCRSLDWLLLTKRPEFARDFLRSYYQRKDDFGRVWTTRGNLGWGCFPNVWVGVSVENQRWTWRADVLREIPCINRFISAEPLLSSLSTDVPRPGRAPLNLDGIDWLIAGGESGPRSATRPMHPDWVRELRDRCAYRGIPFHFKQWGAWVPVATGGVRPGDVCLSRNFGEVAGDDYVCFSNESDGELMRYVGGTPKSGGKMIDGREWCDVPNEAVYA